MTEVDACPACAAKDARILELEEALRPFAEYADSLATDPNMLLDSASLFPLKMRKSGKVLRVRHLRFARTVLVPLVARHQR